MAASAATTSGDEAATTLARHHSATSATSTRIPHARLARRFRGGYGLIGMRERAALLGGSLDATVRNGRFCVHARLPLTPGGT